MGVVRMQLLPAYDTLLVYWPCLRSAEERLRAFLGNGTVELVHNKRALVAGSEQVLHGPPPLSVTRSSGSLGDTQVG